MATANRVFLASSNSGKLAEVRALATESCIEIDALPGMELIPAFEESAPTFSENATGKALYYSKLTDALMLADDSGLVVPALGGAPGVHSARYAGANASSGDRIAKLLGEMAELEAEKRAAKFVCVLALAQGSRVRAIISAEVCGVILNSPHGCGGFGYDPVFLVPELGKTFSEISREKKNLWSHRGRAFRKLTALIESSSAALRV